MLTFSFTVGREIFLSIEMRLIFREDLRVLRCLMTSMRSQSPFMGLPRKIIVMVGMLDLVTGLAR